jgi:hypothetical protein
LVFKFNEPKLFSFVFLLFQTSHHKSSHLTLVHRFDFNLQRKLDNTVSFLVPFAYIFISPFYFTLPFRPFSTDRRLVCCWVPSWLSARISPGSSPCTLLNVMPTCFQPFMLCLPLLSDGVIVVLALCGCCFRGLVPLPLSGAHTRTSSLCLLVPLTFLPPQSTQQ